MKIVKDNFEIAIMVATAYTGVTILASLLLIVSVCSNVRCLMIPFLILSMLDIVLCGTLGIVVVVAALVVLVSVAVDLLVALLDPRVRY